MQPAPQSAPRPPLALAEIADLAASLAHRVARNPSDFDDLQQMGLFEYHQAMTDTPTVTNPFGFARTVLLRAMWRFYNNPTGAEEVSLDEWFNTEQDSDSAHGYGRAIGLCDESAAERLELQDYLDHLERACGATARSIAENLISPHGQCAKEIVRRARQQAEKQAAATELTKKHQPRGVKGEIRLSHPVIRVATGLSDRTWWNEMKKIRAFTRKWLEAC